jgi:MoxR-like ATPase
MRPPTFDLRPPTDSLDNARALIKRLDAEVARVIIGQQAVVREVLICLFAGGHCLLRGVPGLAKTLLIKTLADAVNLTFSRIQFTPDLMPSDILGTDVMEEDVGTGRRTMRFIQGPRSTARHRARRRRCSRRCRNTR